MQPHAPTNEQTVHTPWALSSLPVRLAWLTRFRRLIVKHEERLCQLMTEETRKTRGEGLLCDVAPLLASCKWLEKNAKRLLSDRAMGGAPFWMSGTKIIERRLPLGRIALIATWHNPVQTLGIPLAQALLAGNSVVLKPSERVPRTQGFLAQLAQEAGLPSGTLTMTGYNREIGGQLLNTQKFDHVLFTGSAETGHRIAHHLQKSWTPYTMELSARDSAFVLADADPVKAAQSIWTAMAMNGGQAGQGPRRALVMHNIYDAFVQAMGKLALNAKPVELIDEAAAKHCKEAVTKAIARGGRDLSVLMRGGPDPVDQQAPGARYFRPTAIVDCAPEFELVEGKFSGPVLAVVRCVNLEEAVNAHHRCDHHLTASIFTKDNALGERLGARLRVSTVMINDALFPALHPAVSLGGRGASGHGLTRGVEGLLQLTRVAYVSTSPYGVLRLHKLAGWKTELIARALAWRYEAKKAGELARAGVVPHAPAQSHERLEGGTHHDVPPPQPTHPEGVGYHDVNAVQSPFTHSAPAGPIPAQPAVGRASCPCSGTRV